MPFLAVIQVEKRLGNSCANPILPVRVRTLCKTFPKTLRSSNRRGRVRCPCQIPEDAHSGSQWFPLKERIQHYQKLIDQLFEQHPDANIFKSLSRAGRKTAPRLLTELGNNRARYPTADNLQCKTGTSPITQSSGKSRAVFLRRACRKSF